MHNIAKVIDKSTIRNMPIVVSQQFRTPLRAEKEIGLWADRIGEKIDNNKPAGLRILGLYGAVYIESGHGWFVSKTMGKIKIHPGDVMILFPDEPNMYYPDTKWKETWVVWNGPEAAVLDKLGFVSKRNMVFRDSFASVKHANIRLQKTMGKEDIASILERRNIIENMVLSLFREGCDPAMKKRDAHIESVISYLQRHYRKRISVGEIARMAHLSETHFRRCFKRYTGSSPREFILSLRMTKAKQFLSEGKSIKETAGLVGYDDIFYFMRSFKKVTGITAGRFR